MLNSIWEQKKMETKLETILVLEEVLRDCYSGANGNETDG